MSGTYKAIGINLKSSPLGESDRLLTVLTDEYGLIRVVAPGSRKHKSSLSGRSSLFVVNELLLAKGRSLDKVIQAESIESFPRLSQDLRKLTAAQYLAELTLYQALSDQAQTDLLCLLREHLSRLENFPAAVALPSLVHASFHLLAVAGLTPQLYNCCVSQQPIEPELANPEWQVAFSAVAGGTVRLDQLDRLVSSTSPSFRVATSSGSYASGKSAPRVPTGIDRSKAPEMLTRLNATELQLLQHLTQPNLIQACLESSLDQLHSTELLHPQYWQHWLKVERVLRHYAQYHFDRPIRSAALIDVCFSSVTVSSPSLNHDATIV
jgi:DNA repair protein RecO (recombination protein O)